MAYFFSQAAVAVEVFSFGYLASSFVLHTHRRLNQIPGWRTYQATRLQASLSVPPIATTAAKRSLSPVEQLRQECQQAGIKWRDAHGKNKHLKKAEMLVALQQLKQTKRTTVAKPPSVQPSKRAS